VGDLRDNAFAIFVGCGANAVAGEILANIKTRAAALVRYDEMQGDILRALKMIDAPIQMMVVYVTTVLYYIVGERERSFYCLLLRTVMYYCALLLRRRILLRIVVMRCMQHSSNPSAYWLPCSHR